MKSNLNQYTGFKEFLRSGCNFDTPNVQKVHTNKISIDEKFTKFTQIPGILFLSFANRGIATLCMIY